MSGRARRVVVFELVHRRHYLLLWWLLRRGYVTYYMFPPGPDRYLGRVHNMQARGLLRHLRVNDYPFVNTGAIANRAFEAAERLYGRLEQCNPLIGRFERLYGSPDIRLAFKKQLLFQLTEYFHCRALREQLSGMLEQDADVLFVPMRAVHARLSVEFDDLLEPKSGDPRWRRVAFPWWVRALGLVAVVSTRMRAVAACAYSMAGAIWGALHGERLGPAQYFEFAVPVVSPLREFANDVRGVDFLLDHDRIRRDNTVFVPVVRLSTGQIQKMRERGLAVAELGGRITGQVAQVVFRNGLKTLLNMPAAAAWVTLAAAHLVHEYWVWNSFLSQYHIDHFVSYADFGIRQIGRNILLRHHGAQTWYYLDAENLGTLNFSNHGLEPRRHQYWCYLTYDNLVAWSQRVVEFHRTHAQRVGRYFAVGCIWSEHVRMLRERRDSLSLRQRLKDHGWQPHQKVIAVFDTTYDDFSHTTYQDGVQFATAMQGLLDTFPEIFIAWKEKKPRWVHWRTPRLLSSVRGPSELLQVYERLSRHPRCCFVGYEASGSELLALSDLAISFPFSSPTVEALGARQRGVFYAPDKKQHSSYFELIPSLVARGNEELVAIVQRLLYEVSDEEYSRYLDSEIKGRIDPYLDSRGLTRFRQLLANGNIVPPVESLAPG